ncbi:MAG: DNA polymerase-1 [Candidatus Azotimanducaceae bacterium]|jgi:DNA polymerase-1
MVTKTATKKTDDKKKTLVLLDAHAILHRAYHALPDFSSPSGEPTGALYGVVAMLLKIVEELKPDYIAACFDLPEPTYRHDAFDGYKAGRKKTDDTLIQQIIRSRDIFAAFGIPIYEHVGFEADDLLGTIAHQTRDNKDLTVIIASGDMDTLQCVEKKRVQVYTLRKGIKDTIMYDEQAVKDRFGFGPLLVPDYKGLRGDASDNIPGIAGIGEKTATDLIMNFGTLEKMYKELEKKTGEQKFLDAGIKARIINLLRENKEEAEFSKMLATIRVDVPSVYVLPTEHWTKTADAEATLALFSELGFRTLAARIKHLFEIPEDVSVDQMGSGVSDDEVIRAGVMLWLLESDRTNPSYEDVVDYGRAYLDTAIFSEIVSKLEVRLAEEKLVPIYEEIEKPLLEVITHLNATGVILDTAYLQTLSKTMHTELSSLEKKIYKHAGTTELNINSPKQMAEVLFDTLGLKPKNQKKTATGQRSTKESELEKMKDDHPIINDILRYRELQKLVSTYIDNLPTMVGNDGRLHTTFIQTGAATGRMASQNPGLQNIPTRTEEGRAIRKGFVAGKGYTMVAIDYSQIELRIAAVLSEDPKLIEIFKKGEDVHSGVASRVFGVKEEDITSDMRRKAKIINFGILYGMGVNALRANLGEDTSREEAQEFLNAYFNTFTRLAEYLEETKEFAREHGYTETLFGRKRHFPGITSGAPFIKAAAERMAINAPVQGTAADVMRIAMNTIYQYIKKEKLEEDVKMLLQVHDELVFEIKDELVDSVVPKLVAHMESVLTRKDDKDVPILADVKAGPNWGSLEDWKR